MNLDNIIKEENAKVCKLRTERDIYYRTLADDDKEIFEEAIQYLDEEADKEYLYDETTDTWYEQPNKNNIKKYRWWVEILEILGILTFFVGLVMLFVFLPVGIITLVAALVLSAPPKIVAVIDKIKGFRYYDTGREIKRI